jgi:hypothetical protein
VHHIRFDLTALLPPKIRLPKKFMGDFQYPEFSKSEKTPFRARAQAQAPEKKFASKLAFLKST